LDIKNDKIKIMKKVNIIVIGFLVLVIVALMFLLFNEWSTTPQSKVSNNPEQTKTSETKQDQTNDTKLSNSYIDYSEANLAKAEGQAVIFFHAPWCPQCRELEASIKSEGVPEGFTILKTDYDSSTQLKQKYDVTIQTTLVKVDENGDLIEKFVAYDEPTISAVSRDFLK